MPTTDYEWGLKVLKEHQHLFSWLERKLAARRDTATTVRSGQIWFALPDGSFTVLLEKHRPEDPKRRAIRQCFGIMGGDHWTPIKDRLPGPCAMELHLVDRKILHFDPEHARPGLVLCEPHSRGANSIPLLRFGRALWVRGASRPRNGHGQLRVQGATSASPNRRGAFPFWAAWGISARSGEDLLRPVGDLNQCMPVDQLHGDLHDAATSLMAELLGLREWSGDPSLPRTTDKPVPRRGEVVIVRFGPGGARAPCVVVSPSELQSSYDDVVALRCIPYHVGDEDVASLVPLSAPFRFDDQRWTVDLTLVRGIAFSDLFVETCTPDRYDVEPQTMELIDRRLGSLYA